MTIEAYRPLNEAARFIFYDLDGTLIDTFEDIARALNFALTSLGLQPRPMSEVKRFVGGGIERLVRLGLGENHQAQYEAATRLAREYYEAHAAETARVYPGVLETLAALKTRGVRQAVLTNKPHEIALQTCALAGVTPLVDRVQGEAAGFQLKPDPRAAFLMLEEFKISPDEAAMVGDGEQDVGLGRAAGLRVIGCTWGVSSREELNRFGAQHVIDDIRDLISLIAPDFSSHP